MKPVSTDRFWLCSVLVWFGFGYFILKTKNYTVFWVFFLEWAWFRFGLVFLFFFVWFSLFLTKSVRFDWSFLVLGIWNWTRTEYFFLNILIGLINFFYSSVFFSYLFFNFFGLINFQFFFLTPNSFLIY